MADATSPDLTQSGPTQSGSPVRMTTRAVWLVAGLLILLFAAADVVVLRQAREHALRGAEKTLSTTALTLAEQAERALQGIDLILLDLTRYAHGRGAEDVAAFDRIMSTEDAHATMRQRIVGLPQVSAIQIINMAGYVESSSRLWPFKPIDLRDRDYVARLIGDEALELAISTPLYARVDGSFTIFMARKMRGPAGTPIGILAAAIELPYFEDFYRAITATEAGATFLMRSDGVIVARYPPTDTVGKNYQTPARLLGTADAGASRGSSPVDGIMRIKAARRLKSYPLVVLTSVEQTVALHDWWRMVWILGVATGAGALAIAAAAATMARRWRQLQALSADRERLAHAEAALMRARERHAEAESQAKSGFLAMMSHEIRTPMNGVLGLAGTLIDTPLSGQQREMVLAIQESGDSLLRILNDILDYSKLDAGKMQLEDSAFSPAALTQNPISLLGSRAAVKGLALHASCGQGMPAAVRGDPGRLRQVLLNLVSNAIKFTERGSVTIWAECVAREPNHATLVWRVTDTGIGIPEDRIGGLFAEFMQVDTSITRRFGGSGLGLAISKRLIEQMGGSIGVVSDPAAGSTFEVTVRLPVTDALCEDEPAPFDVVAAFAARLRQMGRAGRILFAEDNPTNQFVALQFLRGFDVQTDTVGDGLEAVHAASSFVYDVICMDMRMPDMDGLTATRLIRARGGALASIPIIALTANAYKEDVDACYAAGMTGFIAKPVRKEAFLAALLAALDQAGPTSPRGIVTEPAEPPGDAFDQAGFARLREDIGEDAVAELVRLFQTDARDMILALGVQSRDPRALEREAHSLKGAASAVCAPALAGAAAAVEQRLARKETVEAAALAGLTQAFDAWRAAVTMALRSAVMAE